jgi:hypothetical protein
MTYRCGTYGMDHIGIPTGDPKLVCDGCGCMRSVTKRSGMPYAWFLNRKKAPGWKMDSSGDMRKDYCPDCEIP